MMSAALSFESAFNIAPLSPIVKIMTIAPFILKIRMNGAIAF